MPATQLIYSLPPLLTAGLLIGLSWVSLKRARPTRANRLFALLCLMGGLLYVDILISFNAHAARTALVSNRIGHMLHPFLIPLFIHFFHAFLGIEKRRWLIQLAYVYAALVAVLATSGGIIAGVQHHSFGYFGRAGRLYGFMAGAAGLATLYNLVLIFVAIRHEQNSIQRNKLKYVFIGFGALGVLSSLNFLTLYGLPVYPPGVFGFIPMAVFAAGVFKYDLLDMGLLIRKGLLYSVLTAGMTGLYALVIVAAQARYGSLAGPDSLLFPLVLFVLIAFMFGPIKNRVQGGLDRLFARGRADYRKTIKRVSASIVSLLDREAISRLLRATIEESMQVKACTFLPAGDGGRARKVSAGGGPAVLDGADAGQSDVDPPSIGLFKDQHSPVIKRRLMGAAE
ncbi:MAG: histidine kinase N-terminal 7TM domain-containing protein, partial [Desulfosarcinaceae bacterium]